MSTAIATPAPAPTPAPVRLVLKLIAALLAAAFIVGGTLTLSNLMARDTFTVDSSYAGVRSLNIDSGQRRRTFDERSHGRAPGECRARNGESLHAAAPVHAQLPGALT